MLVEPPFDEVGEMVRENVQLCGRASYDISGRSLAELAHQARADLLRDAVEWTSAYRDVSHWVRVLCGAAEETGDRRQETREKKRREEKKTECGSLPTAYHLSPTDCSPIPNPQSPIPSAGATPASQELPPIFLAGHQPQLFHPGVWLKNFALGSLARQHGAVAVNLVVDSDTAKGVALRVPGGSVSQPHATMIPYDAPAPAVPYEERAILDRRLLDSFDRRVFEQLCPLVPEPLIRNYWPLVRQRAEATGNLGASLAQARHQLEGQWGLHTLEVPQSRVCDSEAFHWFAGHILAELPRFHAVYNAALAEYRRVHGIRNAAQPMPDLASDGPWLEAPFWGWSAADPQRRHLFARREGERILLRAGEGGGERGQSHFRWGESGSNEGGQSHFRLDEDWDSPLKIRSRALITTLWARLVLGDLFLHGIGGAKYDQLTDLLIERFFGLAPPGFMVISATLHLPIEGRRAGFQPAQDAGRLGKSSYTIAQRLRDLTYHPERCLAGPGRQSGDGDDVPHASHPRADARGSPDDLHALIAEKARWIAASPTPENARTRCRAIRDINARLQPWVTDERAGLLREQEEAARALQCDAILEWREYGFCLYPEEPLKKIFAGLLPKIA
jgi:hypothetical protein